MKPEKLLLHHCCAPCSFEMTKHLVAEFDVAGFWYNPNVHPALENGLRRESLVQFAETMRLPLSFGEELAEQDWVDRLLRSGADDRCRFCYTLRLSETARVAKEQGARLFSSTLLASPFQKHEMIRELGREIGEREKLCFVYRDFRPLYFQGKNEAKKQGFYIQRYCGCLFSKQEREKEKRGKELKTVSSGKRV